MDVELFEHFANFKNPDGTYDGLNFMAQVSGISEDEVKAIWEKVKADKND